MYLHIYFVHKNITVISEYIYKLSFENKDAFTNHSAQAGCNTRSNFKGYSLAWNKIFNSFGLKDKVCHIIYQSQLGE